MTITLSEDTVVRLRRKGEREGRDIDTVADSIIADLLDAEENARSAEIAAVREGLKAGEEGREKPFRQYIAEQRARGLLSEGVSSVTVRETTPGVFEVDT